MRQLDDIPGDNGLPILGHTLAWLRDPIGTPVRMQQRYGDVFRHHIFFARPVVFAHPDALGQIFADEGESLSTAAGWLPFFGPLLPGGLLLRDHADHRYHRGLMQSAFSTSALRQYVQVMNPRIAAIVASWRGQSQLLAWPTFRKLTLELAAVLFLGVELAEQLSKLTHAFEDLARGVAAVLPARLPGTAGHRAQRARMQLVDFLRTLIVQRRIAATPDLLGQLCHATDAQGSRFTDDEIISHILFMWMAAHDTTTGSLVMLAYELARDPQWQQRVRSEAADLGPVITYDQLPEAKTSEAVINEVLRLYPPVGSLPRRTLRAVEIAGVQLPAQTPLRASILLAQRHPQLWTQPHTFDPERFFEARAEHRRHKFAFRPFGGGAHACLGIRFAMLQLKCVMHHVLQRYQLALPAGYRLQVKPTPSFRPADDLPLQLSPVDTAAAAPAQSSPESAR